MPLQAYQNDDPHSIVWHDREAGPDRLAGCNGLIIQALFPGAPVQMQVMGLGLGAFLGLRMKGKGNVKGMALQNPFSEVL